jgi:hypothetical protein
VLVLWKVKKENHLYFLESIMPFSNSYAPLTNAAIKSTTVTLLSKFWDAQLKAMGVTYSGEPGIRATIEHIGQNHFVETFQKYAYSEGEIAPGFELYTLGELAASRQAESELVQFEVNPARVEKFLGDAQMGLLKVFTLLEPLLVLNLPEDVFIVGGGRHRLTGFLTLYKVIEGWEDINIAVRTRDVATIDEAVHLITASNGSRAMSSTEVAQLKAATRGISVVRSPEEILEQLANRETLTDYKNIAMLYFVAKGNASPVLSGNTGDTMGKLGNNIIAKIASRLNTFGKGAALEILKFTQNGSKVAQMIIEYSFELMEMDWEAQLDAIKEPIKDRKSGSFKVDENNNTLFSYNVARNVTTIAANVVESVFTQLEDQLHLVYTAATKAKAEEKAAKEGAKVAKAATATVNKAQSALDYLNSMGVTLTPEQQAAIAQLKAEAEAKIAETATMPEPGTERFTSELDALLG